MYEALAYVVVIGAPILLGTAIGWVAHRMKGDINEGRGLQERHMALRQYPPVAEDTSG